MFVFLSCSNSKTKRVTDTHVQVETDSLQDGTLSGSKKTSKTKRFSKSLNYEDFDNIAMLFNKEMNAFHQTIKDFYKEEGARIAILIPENKTNKYVSTDFLKDSIKRLLVNDGLYSVVLIDSFPDFGIKNDNPKYDFLVKSHIKNAEKEGLYLFNAEVFNKEYKEVLKVIIEINVNDGRVTIKK
jgi:hypothetical protein